MNINFNGPIVYLEARMHTANHVETIYSESCIELEAALINKTTEYNFKSLLVLCMLVVGRATEGRPA